MTRIISKQNRKICSYCVMETLVDTIILDEEGRCNCCKNAQKLIALHQSQQKNISKLLDLYERIKFDGKGKKYDALIGISGGIDSAYLAHILRDSNLRVLVLHVDAGWNTVESVSNIESIVKTLNLEFISKVIEWDEIRELQLAFLKSGVFDQDMPQDHAFLSAIFQTMKEYNITWFLSGTNLNTECMAIPGLGVKKLDKVYMSAINKKFGKKTLELYPSIGFLGYLSGRMKNKIKICSPLNYVNFNKKIAESIIRNNYDWFGYGEKHCESSWTKFYQEVYLPERFQFDKRRIQLSSLIISGQITRKEAIEQLVFPMASDLSVLLQKKFVSKKLNISLSQLEELLTIQYVEDRKYINANMLWDAMVYVNRLVYRYKFR